MEISDDLLCLFSAEVTERDGSYVLEVPDREVGVGSVEEGGTYRVALLPTEPAPGADRTRDSASTAGSGDAGDAPSEETSPDRPEPPVEPGEERTVEIEGIGEQGDGIARVERGYVVIVPETETGERVVIEITDVKQNVGFGEVLERKDYYE